MASLTWQRLLLLLCAFAFLSSEFSLTAAEPATKKRIRKAKPLQVSETPEENVLSPAAAARGIDQLLAASYSAHGVTPAPLANDQDFLRRASLDLVGQLPSISLQSAFLKNESPAKRVEFIQELLSSPAYGNLWSHYWTDVIFMRATERRSVNGQAVFQRWMSEELNQNRPWNVIAHRLLNATGDVSEAGETGLYYAHASVPEEIASEASRIFLGIQLSCANCHNHPTEVWKREQFHELAAYFTRVSFRTDNSGERRTFHVESLDQRGGANGGNFDAGLALRRMDRNGDGLISKGEAKGPISNRFDELLTVYDLDKDGQFNLSELEAVQTQLMQRAGRGKFEYMMSDLENPSEPGTMMFPKFFLASQNDSHMPRGTGDSARRLAISEQMSQSDLFAKAFVNRMWNELLGHPFTEYVDDLGAERQVNHPEVFNYLANAFAQSGYDIKWLFETIMRTDAYQRALIASEAESDEALFASAVPRRLRADQIQGALQAMFEGQGRVLARFSQNAEASENVIRSQARQRAAFAGLFGFDPSSTNDEMAGSVPQALFLMNSNDLNQQLVSNGRNRISLITKTYSSNDDLVNHLYCLVLTRTPSEHERATAVAYIGESRSRAQGVEDLMWVLVNSAEFVTRR